VQTRRKIRRYTLEERKYIYSCPLEQQFVPVFKCGEAVVFRHLIRSEASEDYDRVLDVARALAIEKQGPVYILPEINAHEKELRASLGLNTNNGPTPDIMLEVGSFVDVKVPGRFIKSLQMRVKRADKEVWLVLLIIHCHLKKDCWTNMPSGYLKARDTY